MRRQLVVLIALLAVLLAGCDGRIFLRLDVPILIEPHPSSKYQHEVEGYVSFDYRTEHIVMTSRPRSGSYYEPLKNASVTVLETGRTVRTDQSGYFYLRAVPYGKINLKVEHAWIHPDAAYFTYTSR